MRHWVLRFFSDIPYIQCKNFTMEGIFMEVKLESFHTSYQFINHFAAVREESDRVAFRQVIREVSPEELLTLTEKISTLKARYINEVLSLSQSKGLPTLETVQPLKNMRCLIEELEKALILIETSIKSGAIILGEIR